MEETIAKIKPDFDKVISYSQGIQNPKTEGLLQKWYEAKQYFIEKFGDLIWQSPEKIEFNLNEDDKIKKLNTFLEDTVLYKYQLYDLERFIRNNIDGFYNNEVVNEYKTIEGTVIPKGMKLVKAFKFFVKDDMLLDYLQTTASRIIQEDKVSGYLCLSVHPLDFLSASENNYNWRSCHALDGEYRVGNLSFLLDKVTIICYIKGDEDVVLPNFPSDVRWNNKKWRMWLYLADEHNALMAGRQYPFAITNILNIVRIELFNLLNFSPYRWSNWHNDIMEGYNFKDTNEFIYIPKTIVIGDEYRKLKDIVADAPGSKHYNDLLYSSYYTPYYCWRDCTKVGIHFTVGSVVPCLSCGKNDLYYTDNMICDTCYMGGRYTYCSVCGERINLNRDDYYEVEGDYVCANCFDDECVWCDDCGDAIYRENAHFCEDGRIYCNSCYHRHSSGL